MEIHLLILDGSPQSFYKNIVPPGFSAIHAEFATTVMDGLDGGIGGELAALVGVDNREHPTVMRII